MSEDNVIGLFIYLFLAPNVEPDHQHTVPPQPTHIIKGTGPRENFFTLANL